MVDDSLLRGTEAPICQPDRESHEVCCLPGAKIRGMAKRVPQLVKSTDYSPLLLFHVGTNDTTSWNLGRIKKEFKALGVQVKSIGAQVIFSSILPAGRRGSARNRCIMSNNSWLFGWCCCEGFGFYHNGTFFNDYNLLGGNGTHLSRKGKGIFGSRLSSLMWRALNWSTCGGAGQSHNAKDILSGWGIRVANQSSDKCSLAVSQADKQKSNNLKGGHGHGRSSCTPPGKSACTSSSLKHLYTNAHSMGNKQEELEICVWSQGHNLIAVRETWWDSSHDWNAVIHG